MIVATLLVAGAPIAAVWWLRASNVIASTPIGVLIGMALSLGVSQIGRVLWEARPGSEDILFSELMLWGFLHRRYNQRRLASALDMVGPMSTGRQTGLDALGSKEQARLLERLVAEIETRDPYLHGHSRRVARHSWMIARQMGLGPADVARVRTAAALHDVGKIETPKAILHKAGPLDDDEYAVVKQHPGDGALMASVLGDAELTAMVRHHHERLDGTGYPGGLGDEEIPLGARIIAVADTFDAITSARSYRAASPHKKAIAILKEDAGSRLDPVVVAAFCSFYGGRRPIALWATLAGLPERVASWFLGSVGSVAATAKMLAVAALVGGTAASATALAVPVAAKHPPGNFRDASVAQRRGQSARSRGTAIGAPHTSTSSHQRSQGAQVRFVPSRRAPASAPYQRAASVGAAGASAQQQSISASVGGGRGSVAGASDGAAGRTVSGGSSRASEASPVKGKTEELPGKGAEVPAKAKKESPVKGPEAPGKAKTESPVKGTEAPGKSGEAPGHNKTVESPGKSAEAPGHNKAEEAPGKSGEAPGHNKVEESPAGTTEAPGHVKTEEAPGKSDEAPGHNKADEAPGKSEEGHGKS